MYIEGLGTFLFLKLRDILLAIASNSGSFFFLSCKFNIMIILKLKLSFWLSRKRREFELLMRSEEFVLAYNSPFIRSIGTDEPFFNFPSRSRPFHLQKGSSSQSNHSYLATQVNSGHQSNFVDVVNGHVQDVLPLHEEDDPVLSYASQPSLTQACNRYYENKPSKRFNKSSRPKVIPNSKSYVPMNTPPRRSMPRKI